MFLSCCFLLLEILFVVAVVVVVLFVRTRALLHFFVVSANRETLCTYYLIGALGLIFIDHLKNS